VTATSVALRWADKPGPFNEPAPLVYGVRDGDIVWRANAICMADLGGGYGAILLDLGVVKALTGQPTSRAIPAAPAQAVGVLMAPNQLGGDRAAIWPASPPSSPRPTS
jgi:surfeit locus 1 family protein